MARFSSAPSEALHVDDDDDVEDGPELPVEPSSIDVDDNPRVT